MRKRRDNQESSVDAAIGYAAMLLALVSFIVVNLGIVFLVRLLVR